MDSTEWAEFTTLKKKAIRLCETIWQRQWSNSEDCLMDAIDLMKAINPEHPMVTAKTFRETIAAKKDGYIAIRKENEKLREGLNLIERQVAHIGGNRKFRLGEVYGIKRCAKIARSYLEGGMMAEKIEEICGNCLHWPVCYKLLSQHEGNACSSRLEYGLFRPRKELDELAALKAENEKLREALTLSKSAMETVYNTHAMPHLQRSGTHPRTVDALAPAIQEAQATLDGKEIKGGDDD